MFSEGGNSETGSEAGIADEELLPEVFGGKSIEYDVRCLVRRAISRSLCSCCSSVNKAITCLDLSLT